MDLLQASTFIHQPIYTATCYMNNVDSAVHKLNSTFSENRYRLHCDERKPASIKEIIDDHQVTITGECGGSGKCALCLVQIIRGECSPLSDIESAVLTQEEQRAGFRLACQTRGIGSIELSIPTETQSK